MLNPVHTTAFDLAYHFVTETNENIFLTGKAGTGKTTFLKYLRENQVKNLAVAAPTGVAAINAGGVTLHSLFQLPFGPFIPDNRQLPEAYDKQTLLSRLRYNHEKINFFRSLELLVIDEVSMVPAYIIDAIDTILRSVRHQHQLPFGGVQVLFIGDLYQLQPVVKQEEWQLLSQYYSSIFFFDSLVLRDHLPVMIELKEIFRQKDEEFIGILNGIRDNNLTHENLLRLNQRLDRNFMPGDDDGFITLTTHNYQADSINQLRLKRLSTSAKKFIAGIEGDFPDQMIPADKELVLKENAQVMFIKNDLEEKKFYNGKIGVIDELSDDEIIVRCDDDYITVGKHTWENIKYSTDSVTKEIKEDVVGTFSQYPLRLAWAITIHKSQGLTFEKVVIDAENAFAKGQVYVALSRATSLDGMVLTSAVNDRFLGAHENLKALHDKRQDESVLQKQFEISRRNYVQQQLIGAFSFEYLNQSIDTLKKTLGDLELIHIHITWTDEVITKKNHITDTAYKFEKVIIQHVSENPEIAENQKLQKRIADGAVYFSNLLKELMNSFLNHPLKVPKYKDSRKLDQLLEKICEAMSECTAKISLCNNGFHMNEFLSWKKLASGLLQRVPGTYSPDGKEKAEAAHPELYDRLAIMRNRIAAEDDVPAFMVFSNAAIKNCCEIIPGNLDSLIAVSGFGKKKVKAYGDEVIGLIQEYCRENNIEAAYISIEERKKENYLMKASKLSPTVMQTIELFKSGMNINEIGTMRNLVSSTIEGHLAVGIRNRMIDINQVLPAYEIEAIREMFDNQAETFNLKAAHEKSNDKYSYGKLKMVQSWLVTVK